jgi:hypothetical protein
LTGVCNEAWARNCDSIRIPKFGFAKDSKPLQPVLPVAQDYGTGDIAHSLSTAFRILIAFFG